MHPTVASLVGLPFTSPMGGLPPNKTQGVDLSPLFDDPSKTLKKQAFSQFPNCGIVRQCTCVGAGSAC